MATDIAVVKKLEWVEREDLDYIHGISDYAVTPIKKLYHILFVDGSYRLEGHGKFGSLEAAKAAAQADYEQRILSALSQDYLDLKASHDATVAALTEAADTLESLSFIHDGNPSDAYADVPPVEYARHMLYEARQMAKAAHSEARAVLAALTAPAAPAAPADDGWADDGWIAWAGGSRPVAGFTEVEVKLRDEPGIVEYASRLDWAHFNNESDIVAYRVRPAAGGAL